MKRPKGGREPRKWRIPPAILRGPGETIDRLGVLEEHDDEVAVMLWRIVRDVELWAGTEPGRRRELFCPRAGVQRVGRVLEADLPDEIRPALEALADQLGDAASADPDRVAESCLRVAHWAREGGKGETALAFAQAAALAAPAEPVAALVTALCAIAIGQEERGHTWLRRAIALARQSRHHEVYAGGYLALGRQLSRRGARGSARRAYLLAFRGARRWGLPVERTGAAYGLFRMALEAGDIPAATGYARSAMGAARRLRAELLPFEMELPAFWIAIGEPSRALAVLDRMEPLIVTPDERLAARVFRMRAHLDAGREDETRRLWTETWRMTKEEPVSDTAAEKALVALAGTAARLHDDGLMGRAARAALTRAPAEKFTAVEATLRSLGYGAAREAGERAA